MYFAEFQQQSYYLASENNQHFCKIEVLKIKILQPTKNVSIKFFAFLSHFIRSHQHWSLKEGNHKLNWLFKSRDKEILPTYWNFQFPYLWFSIQNGYFKGTYNKALAFTLVLSNSDVSFNSTLLAYYLSFNYFLKTTVS